MFTSMSLEYMGFQAAIVRGLEWAQFATERLMVSMMGLHMTIQIVPESRDKGAILAAVLVFPGKHGQSQVTPLVRSQTLYCS